MHTKVCVYVLPFNIFVRLMRIKKKIRRIQFHMILFLNETFILIASHLWACASIFSCRFHSLCFCFSVFFLLLNFKLIQSVEILPKIAFKIQSILQVRTLNCITRSIHFRQWLYSARSFSFAHFSLFILYIVGLAIWF